jgi:iron complex transport system ATP-binding protein
LALKLVINDLSFNYAGHQVLKDIEFQVDAGEVLSIVGPNGSGKSTLLKCINRILKTKEDTVLIDGKDATKFNFKDLSKLIGYVPQSSNSTFSFTVFDIVLMGRRPYINWNLSERDSDIVAEVLDFLGIGHLAMRHFNELSGGEQQKVVIARALAQQPKTLLLDEPTSSLDIRHQLEILCMVRSLTQNSEHSVVLTMHDLNLASRFSDRMLMLKNGAIFSCGTPKEVLTEDNIREVYCIESKVSDSFMGIPQVMPLISGLNRIKGSQMPKRLAEEYA